MNISRKIGKLVSCLSIAAILSMQMTPVHAAMVDNNALLNQAQHALSINQIIDMLDREEIQQTLTSMGIDPSSAKYRVSQMNNTELAALNQNLEKMPAGSGVLGVILTVFIVLVITDMLGATDVFPFVKNINK